MLADLQFGMLQGKRQFISGSPGVNHLKILVQSLQVSVWTSDFLQVKMGGQWNWRGKMYECLKVINREKGRKGNKRKYSLNKQVSEYRNM